jgi:hypothetical protein
VKTFGYSHYDDVACHFCSIPQKLFSYMLKPLGVLVVPDGRLGAQKWNITSFLSD